MIRLANALALLAVLAASPAARAQSFNVKCAPGASIPSTYGAGAGQAGHWNPIALPASPVALLGLDGGATGVVATATSGCNASGCVACSAPGCAGLAGSPEDLALFGSWINGACLSSESVTLTGLQPGTYVVHVYAYGCGSPISAGGTVEVHSTSVVFQASQSSFAGQWSGFSYPRIPVQVPAGESLELGFWGITDAGLAGFQIERLEPAGTASCFGDGSGAPCPCGNLGLPGHGCASSSTTDGARLDAGGEASLGSDQLVLGCASVPPLVTSVVLGGSQSIAPVAFGDGLRCAGGALKRLYVLQTTSGVGTLVAPPYGQPSISARSAALGDPLAPGAQRVYQVYYREPDASFCPEPQGAGFNVSNAVEIVWTN